MLCAAYIKGSAALCVVCLLLSGLATILTGLGLHASETSTKSRYYRAAVWVMTLSRKSSGYVVWYLTNLGGKLKLLNT